MKKNERNNPRLPFLLLKLFLPNRDQNPLYNNFEIYYKDLLRERGRTYAWILVLIEIFKSAPGLIYSNLCWRFIMFKNYFTMVLRNIRKYKSYSIINIAGLAIGIACFLLIMLWVQDELRYDKFHQNHKQIYRAGSNIPFQPAPLGPHLKNNFPEVLDATRFYSNYVDVRYKDKHFDETVFTYADSSVFKIFTFPLLKGNPDSALTEPYCVVITEETAKKYFAGEDPIGKSLTIDDNLDYKITGVAKNVPGNSQIQFDFLASFETLEKQSPKIKNHWGNHAYMTFVLLAENTDCTKFTSKIENIVIDRSSDSSAPVPLTLSALGNIHLYENRAIIFVYIFSAIAFFTLIISIINYINLTTARSSDRLVEIGLRKVVGADRRSLINQFLTESIFLLFIAFFIALIIVSFTLPTFNAIVNKNLNLNILANKYLFLLLTGVVLFSGILAGSYPAFLMASFQPAKLIKKSLSFGDMVSKSVIFKRALVIIQFTISIFLIISTFLISDQLHFIRNKDLGFDKENLIYVPVKKNMVRKRTPFRYDLLRNPNVTNVTFTSSLPSGVNNVADEIEWEGKDPGRKPIWSFVATDYFFIKTLGLEIIEGRGFSEKISTDKRQSFIVNETALKRMGQKSPVGKPFSLWGTKGTLIGVVKDFHFSPLHNEIGPLLIFMNDSIYFYMIIKIKPASETLPETINYISSICTKHDPNFRFNYHFLDERFENNYRAEQRMSEIFKYFTFLAIFISCLGLFGLISFSVEQRKKEIGIRKVIGASTANIVILLIKEYIHLILLSNIIAWPLAFLAMNKWLHNFAYRTGISFWIFVGSAVSSIIIALLTVGYQAIKAAAANPINNIMYE